MLNRDDILKKVSALNWPADQYLLISGTVLAAHEIRPAGDIDVVASSDLVADLKKASKWECTKRYRDETEFLTYNDIEVASKLEWLEYPVTLSEAKSREDIIEGIPFMNLRDVIQFKQAMGRDKDKRDIELINKYLAS